MKRGTPKKIEWTAEDRARHKAIRERFQGKPTIEELVAEGELSGQTISQGAHFDFIKAIYDLRLEREHRGLTLADVAERSGLDVAAISRLENGRQLNPTLETVLRYAEALGKKVVWGFEDVKTEKAVRERVKKRKRIG